MTLRRALLALSLVALATPAAAGNSQSAPPPTAPSPSSQEPSSPGPGQPTTPPATRAARPDETPIDPLAIAFDVSPDHDAEDSAGPKLVKYVIDFVPAAGAAGKSHTLDLGKPKPVEGAISVPLHKVLTPGTYMAHVRAIGRGLQTNTVTVGPFVITEKIGKTKEEIDKELRAPDKAQPQDKRTKKPKTRTQTESDAPSGATPAAAPPNTESGNDSDRQKPAKKGFWKKAYEKVVGDPMAP